MKTAAGLRQLLTHAIDYAGLFPPAKLSLDQAIHNYARYRTDADAWLLGRFVIPTSRLGDLDAFEQLFGHGPAFLFASLGSGGGESATAVVAGLRNDLQAIGAFQKKHGNAFVDVLELKWPNIPVAEAPALFESVAGCIEQHKGSLTLTPYFELPFSGDWRGLVTALKHFREDSMFSRRMKCRPPGMKLRCGGLDVAAFPSPEQVAAVLHCCLVHRVPLKCTAGLHHPLRHHHAAVQVMMHGFINVFGAGVLGQVHGLDGGEVAGNHSARRRRDAFRL